MPIRRLPPELVNQIAAGEVVERPASVVKELVENAIDAGASRIAVRIEGGGRDLIEVVDDGAGIPSEELPLAVAAHATSKIRSTDDLARIATMGFRGEALASIASVSRLEIVSRTAHAKDAARIEVDGGTTIGPMPASGPPGTSVRVRTLFHNVPARRRFLRSEPAEAGRVTETMESIAAANPAIRFRLDSGTRTVLDLDATDDPRRRVESLLGEQIAPELIEFTQEAGLEGAGRIAVWGVVARPGASKASGRHQRLFVNGRPIVDRSLLHAVKEAFRGVIDPQRHPVAVIRLEIDPAEVDVNVHPAKSEVRFRQPAAVHSFLLRAVRGALRSADLVPSFDPSARADAAPIGAATAFREHGDLVHGAPGREGHRRDDLRGAGFDDRASHGILEAPFDAGSTGAPTGARESSSVRPDPSAAPLDPPPSLPTLLRAQGVLQVHQSYLVMEDPLGIAIVDQHALHERVLFEEISARIAGGSLERQLLLAPIMLEVGALAAERIETLAPLLARLGFEATPAGPRTVAVHAVPSLLASRRVDAARFLAELLESEVLRGAGDEREAAIHRVIDMMACKAAVKAGERLTDEEILRLLASRHRIERSTNCPHGRPTTLRIPLKDLERHFGR